MAKKLVPSQRLRDKMAPYTYQRLLDILGTRFKLDELKMVYWTLCGERLKNQPKATVVEMVADRLSFKNRAQFEAFFSTLPDYLQTMIHQAVFRDFCELKTLERTLGLQLVQADDGYLRSKQIMAKDLRVHCFALDAHGFIRLRDPFRSHFASFMDPPPAAALKPLAPEVIGQARWINDEMRRENIGLALENLPPFFPYIRQKRVKGSFKKGELNALRSRIGLELFPLSGKKGPDPVALMDSFLCAFYSVNPPRPKDIDEWTKEAIDRFFLHIQMVDSWSKELDSLTGASFEYFGLCPHLSSDMSNSFLARFTLPISRLSFRALLVELASTGAWYDFDAIMESLQLRNISRLFWRREESSCLFRKGEALISPRMSLRNRYASRIYAEGPLTEDLVHRPLFASYFYLMALLGLVEIEEGPCTATIESGDKSQPLSPWSFLKAVRVTAFGLWCLGLSDEKPQESAASFEAIAASDLLLVTFRGKSLERKLYLKSIGEALGSERYRVTLKSFMRGCLSASDVKERIKRFTSLIEEKPSPKWKLLFETALRRASIYQRFEDGVLLDLGANADDVRAILSSDSSLARLVVRAEGCRIFVRASDLDRFAKLMGAHGFLPPPWK